LILLCFIMIFGGGGGSFVGHLPRPAHAPSKGMQ
jgi:hypothetical protein